MEQNKTRAYLLYAFGEVLLVVVGILIALQVNNWNQDRMNELSSQDYQQRLQDDLFEELSVMESVIDYGETTRKYALGASSVFESGALAQNDSADSAFLIDLYQASQIQDASGSSATYQELLSSGQIAKIKNQSLRSSIINYYSYDWAKSIVFTVEDPYRENIRKMIPTQIQSRIRKECGDQYIKSRNTLLVYLSETCSLRFEDDQTRTIARSILNDESIKNNLRYRIGNLDSQITLVQSYRDELKKIIAVLEDEI